MDLERKLINRYRVSRHNQENINCSEEEFKMGVDDFTGIIAFNLIGFLNMLSPASANATDTNLTIILQIIILSSFDGINASYPRKF